MHPALLEQVEDPRRPERVGSVVEGERDASSRLSPLALEDPARRVLQVVRALQRSVGVPGHLAAAGLRRRFQRDQLAAAVELDVVGVVGDEPVERLPRVRLVEGALRRRPGEQVEELEASGADPTNALCFVWYVEDESAAQPV